jgi:1-aminocyclopropane-1-carboxylate deaminase/D-cysteine desulfhydrase-like pyridoxal-dependent ACC family enzyme
LEEISHPVFDQAGVRVLLKREDMLDPLMGGNKWRKLKYNLIHAEVAGHRGIVTFGGHYSNHLVAVAEAGSRQGLPTIGYVRDSAEHPSAFTTLAQGLGMSLRFVSRDWFRRDRTSAFIDSIGSIHPGFLVIPEGGSNRLGLKGVAEIVDELPTCEIICCPCGTGGTVAGLVIGLAGRSKVLGVAAWRGKGRLEQDIDDMLASSNAPWRNYEITYNYHGGGFGKADRDLIATIGHFQEVNGLWLDVRFTGKMMLALLREARGGRLPEGSTVIALHTGLPATKEADERLWNSP